MRVTRKKLTSVVATTAVVALGAGAAIAYWTSTGNGTGAGSTGTSASFTVAGGAITGVPLTPGAPSQSIAFTVTNPTTGGLFLNSVAVTVATAGGGTWTIAPSGGAAGCSAADYTVGTITVASGELAAGASRDGTVLLTMNDRSGVNQNNCKLAPVPLYFAAS